MKGDKYYMEKKYNTRIKKYSDDNYNITFCNRKIFKPNTTKKKKNTTKKVTDTSSNVVHHVQTEKNIFRSCKRAREKIFDIIYLNKFDFWVTLTFDPKKVDSFSFIDVMDVTRKYFYKIKRICPNFSYIIVPELHSSGRVHIHSLVTDCSALKLCLSSVSNRVYNVTSWSWGWSTAIRLYSSSNVKLSLYVTKYITKNTRKIFGKYYWSSKNLKRDVETIYLDNDYFEVDLSEYSVPQSNIKLKYLSHFDIK